MSTDSLRSADRQILEYLRENPPDYIPLIANRLGMNLTYAERRCEVLVEEELMQPVTRESIYGLTDRGERYLAGDVDLAAQAADD